MNDIEARLKAFARDCVIHGDMTPAAEQQLHHILDNTAARAAAQCWCHDCNSEANFMIVCPDCGNKRCPHAHQHILGCTGSNAPNQPGTAVLGPETAEDHEFWEQTRAALAEMRASRGER